MNHIPIKQIFGHWDGTKRERDIETPGISTQEMQFLIAEYVLIRYNLSHLLLISSPFSSILYQMSTGKPAFSGSNPLTVAQKIVSGSYAPLPSSYSPLFHEMVRRLLTVDPQQRPDILAVSSLISPLLMAELDRVNIAADRLQQQLQHEQEKHRREKEEWMREKQIWRKWMTATANNNRSGLGMGPSSGSSSLTPGANTPTTTHFPGPILARSGSGSMSGMGFNTPSNTGSATTASTSAEDAHDGITPPTSSPMFRVSTSQIRPTSHDPLTLLLTQIHKLIYITQLPPKSTRDLKRSVIAKYKNALFSRAFNSGDLKRELQQIVSGSSDPIDPSFELPHLDAAVLLSSPAVGANAASTPSSNAVSSGGASNSRLTHEEIQLMIEQVLEETGYYQNEHKPMNPSNTNVTYHPPSTPATATSSSSASIDTTSIKSGSRKKSRED